MLDCYILTTTPSVSYGSVTLKSLQNDNVPELDLLVREAIQNSSDASLETQGDFYNVNFTTGTFRPASFNNYLEGVCDYLNERFNVSKAHYLEIRDTGTSGLTGCTRISEADPADHGNYIKLIFDTGKKQTQNNAGGNWGFGKSVYYRVGIGIVVFYSRIKKDSEFESRLIVTLVEDEGKKNDDNSDGTILNRLNPSSAGKAWWGIKAEEDILPICDESIINGILDVFGLKPFTGDKTGTSIIVPYLDSDRLLGDIIPEDVEMAEDVKDVFATLWTQRVDDYLRLAIQKWYAPKVHNLSLTSLSGKKWLLATVNNVPIKKTDMLPFFQLVQEMYNTAIAKTYDKQYDSSLFNEIKCKPVNVRNYFDGMTTGYVSMVEITADQLNGMQNAIGPYDCIGHFEADGGLNEPVVMFTRDPGMVIDYPINGPWVKGINVPDNPETFLFAFYMPIIEKRLRQSLNVPKYAGMGFGEYLRNCEASDHMGWNDPVPMKLISRIQKNCVRIINENSSVGTQKTANATASKLAGKLGRKLLPRVGYGKKTSTGTGGNGGQGGGKVNNILFEYQPKGLNKSKMELEFSLTLMHAQKKAEVSLLVLSEGGNRLSQKVWVDDIGTEFPIHFQEIHINSISYGLGNCLLDGQIVKYDSNNSSACICGAQFALSEKSNYGHYSSFIIQTEATNLKVSGTAIITTKDPKYRFSFKID